MGGHRKIKFFFNSQKCALATTPDHREIPKVGRSRLRLGQQDRSVLQGVVGNHSFVCVCGEGAKCPPFPHTLQQGPFSLG